MRARPFVAAGLLRVDAAPAVSNAYAFAYDDPTFHAWLYLNGSWVSNRTTITQAALGTINPNGCSIIYEDSAALVGDGSLTIYPSGGSSLYVWDVDGANWYSYAVPAGWALGAAPVYASGYIYWPEIETTPDGGGAFDVRLRKARTDFTSTSTVNTFSFTHDAGATTPTIFAFGLAGASGLVWAGSRPGYAAGTERMIRFPFSGGATGERDYSGDTYKPSEGQTMSPGMADASGNCVFGVSESFVGLDELAYKQADGVASGWVALWPDWAGVGPYGVPLNTCSSVNPNGTVLTIHHAGDEVSNGDTCVQDLAAGTASPSPDAFFEVLDHPGTALDAQIYFYFGD